MRIENPNEIDAITEAAKGAGLSPDEVLRMFSSLRTAVLVALLGSGCSDESVTEKFAAAPLQDSSSTNDSNATDSTRPHDSTGADSASNHTGDTSTAPAICAPANPASDLVGPIIEVGVDFREEGGEELSGLACLPAYSQEAMSDFCVGAGDRDQLYTFKVETDGAFNLQETIGASGDNEGVTVRETTGANGTEICADLVDEDEDEIDSFCAGDPNGDRIPDEALSKQDSTENPAALDCILQMPNDMTNNLGIEGFGHLDAAPSTWVDAMGLDAYGYLVAGSQTDDHVGVFPASACRFDAVIAPSFTIDTSDSDIAGIAAVEFPENPESTQLLVLHDNSNTLDLVRARDGVLLHTWTLPTNGQEEAIAVTQVQCGNDGNLSPVVRLVIGDDVSGEVNVFEIPANAQ